MSSDPLIDLRAEVIRTFVEGFIGRVPLSDGGGCRGRTSDFSGFLDGSTNIVAALREREYEFEEREREEYRPTEHTLHIDTTFNPFSD